MNVFHSQLEVALRPTRRRGQLYALWRAAATGLLIGSLIALAIVMGRRLRWELPGGIEWGIPLIAAALAVLRPLMRPPRWAAVARSIDDHYGLQDRVRTAWALAQHEELTGLERLQIQDALRRLQHVRPRAVLPGRVPARFWSAIGFGLVALTLSLLPVSPAVPQPSQADQQRQDAVNRQTAEQLDETLLRELQRLAELTQTAPVQLKSLQDLPARVAEKLDRLKQGGLSEAATLATLSEIQAAIAEASRQVSGEAQLAHLDQLAETVSAAESLQGLAEAIQLRDLRQAAEEADQLDPAEISELERQTLAEQLKDLVEAFRESGDEALASALAPLQQGLDQQDPQLVRDAADQLANALRQQALQLTLQAELSAQLGQISEAKGVSRSGGSNTAPSNESRQTWGQGRAGDPLSGEAREVATMRQREVLTGVQGEGPTDRQTMRVEADQGEAQRPLQPAFQQFEQAAEEVLRKEPLPLGYRQTIRQYFRSIRPASEP